MANNYNYSPPKLSIEAFRGLNEYANPYGVRYGDAIYTLNCSTSDGALSRIKGYEPYLESGLSTEIGTIIPFYSQDSKQLLIASGGKLYKYYGGTLTEIASGFKSDKFDYVNFEIMSQDVVILTNGVDNVKVWNGTSIRDLKHKGYSSTDASDNKAPKGKIMELHYGRVWIASDSTVFFSTSNRNGYDPDDWTTPLDDEKEINQHGGYIMIPTWDGGKIIGMKTIFDDIVVFKNQNIFKILGTYPGEYEVRQLFSTDGAIADKSIVSSQNVAYYLDIDGIFTYNGVNVECISHPVQNIIKRINKNYAEEAVGAYFKDSYFVAVPLDDSTKNNVIIEYNTVKRDFLIHEISDINSLLVFDDKLLFSDLSGMVYELFSGDKFYKKGTNGININAKWETGIYDLNNKNAVKSAQYIYFAGKGNGKIIITCISENGERSTTPIELTEREKIFRVKLKNKGRTIQLRFENIDGADFTIIRPELIVDVDFD